jgi:hypothetical protein
VESEGPAAKNREKGRRQMTQQIITRHLTARQIERVLRGLVPGQQIYVLFSTQVPERFRPKNVFGLTCKGLDVALHESLGKRFTKRGRVIILDCAMCRSFAFAARPLIREVLTTRRQLLQTAGHELAHIVIDLDLPGEETPQFAAIAKFAMEKFAAAPAPRPAEQPIPWTDHNGRFFRVVLHIAHRMRSHVRDWLPYDGWIFPEAYGLSRERQYAAALDHEPEELAHLPLRELSTIAPPAAFAELWRADIRGWWLSVENPTDAQTSALTRGLALFPKPNAPAESPTAGSA